MTTPAVSEQGKSLFDRILWRDPVTGRRLEPIISARNPSGVPVCGALKVEGTQYGYPIVDSIIRLTPELAHIYRDWLTPLSLDPPPLPEGQQILQNQESVDSFGWQWGWNSEMRTEADLRMRVAGWFNVDPSEYKGKLAIDMGAGAGDQSRYMMKQGASVVSIDLSNAIEVVARKLKNNSNWVGVQGDIMALPFVEDQFEIVYCEGVIQHTENSVQAIKELCRTVKPGGMVIAAHYVRDPANTPWKKFKRKFTLGYYNFLRDRMVKMERFKLLFLTGLFTALGYVPLLGWFFRKTGMTLYYDLQPDFKTSWLNTYDYYGQHAFQRIIAPEEFWNYFEQLDDVDFRFKGMGRVVVTKKDKAAQGKTSSPLASQKH